MDARYWAATKEIFSMVHRVHDFLFYQTGELLRNIIHVHVYNFIPMTKSMYMTLNPVLAELLKAGFAGILF